LRITVASTTILGRLSLTDVLAAIGKPPHAKGFTDSVELFDGLSHELVEDFAKLMLQASSVSTGALLKTSHRLLR
jgi:hypothetical protein